MRDHTILLQRVGILALAMGLALPLCAQDAGPLPPSPSGQGATQTAPAKGAALENPPAATHPANGKVVIPTGTHIPLVLHNGISTRSAKPGDPVYFETLYPVMLDGRVVIPAGSYVNGEITEAKRAGRVKGRSELMIRLTTLILTNGYMVNLAAVPSEAGTGGAEKVNNEGKVVGDTDKAGDVGTVVKSTAAGAGIGAIASRSGTGAGIGAGVGAAAGLAAVLLTRGPDAEMPRGTTVDAVLDHPVTLDADKDQFTSPGQASTLAGPSNRERPRARIPF